MMPELQVASIVGRAELLSAICYFIVVLSYMKCCAAGMWEVAM